MLNAIVRPFLGLPSGCEGLFDLIDTHGHYCRLNHISVFVPQVRDRRTRVSAACPPRVRVRDFSKNRPNSSLF